MAIPDDLSRDASAQAGTPASEPAEVTPPPEPVVIPEAGLASPPAPEVPENPPLETAQPEKAPESERAQTLGNEPLAPESEPFPQIPTEPPAGGAPVVSPPQLAHENSVKGNAEKQRRVRVKLDSIMLLIGEKKTISGGDVQKLLRVSKPTATRYLNQLEKEGKIVQVGAKGRGVLYVRAS